MVEQLHKLSDEAEYRALKQVNIRLPNAVLITCGYLAEVQGLSVPKLIESWVSERAVENKDAAQQAALARAEVAERDAYVISHLLDFVPMRAGTEPTQY